MRIDRSRYYVTRLHYLKYSLTLKEAAREIIREMFSKNVNSRSPTASA